MSTKTDELMRLADRFAHVYSFVGDDTMPVASAALRSAIQEALSEWRPIETAPKDGNNILLANDAGVSEGGWLTDIDCGADWEGQLGMAGWWRVDGSESPNTHWMPLPEGPKP